MTEQKPSYLRAAIGDWKNGLISNGKLFEIWQVSFHEAFHKLLDETEDYKQIPADRIEQILESCQGEIDAKEL